MEFALRAIMVKIVLISIILVFLNGIKESFVMNIKHGTFWLAWFSNKLTPFFMFSISFTILSLFCYFEFCMCNSIWSWLAYVNIINLVRAAGIVIFGYDELAGWSTGLGSLSSPTENQILLDHSTGAPGPWRDRLRHLSHRAILAPAELDFRFPVGAPIHGMRAFLATNQLKSYDKERNALALALSPVVKAPVDPYGALRDDDIKRYKLLNPRTFFYLKQLNCYELDGVDDSKEYLQTRRAMNIVGISSTEQVDYEKRRDLWSKMERSSSVAWNTNMDSLVQWSPYSSEAVLLQQFNSMSDQATRVIIYNLWEDDEGQLELDFVADVHDIQIRGANRDEKKFEMANNFPNSRHFLTYRHSLRSYASILYLRLPQGFRMILRGKEIEHHNIVNDMMMKQEMTYRPQSCPDGFLKDSNIYAVVTIGFVKDATNHIDVQGFNVYHKNRLIKPFWRVWNAAGSDGRGVIGVLEANFVEPAHDKQGFERTTVPNRLEARLLHIQKTHWSSNCQEIGYAPRRQKKSGRC